MAMSSRSEFLAMEWSRFPLMVRASGVRPCYQSVTTTLEGNVIVGEAIITIHKRGDTSAAQRECVLPEIYKRHQASSRG